MESFHEAWDLICDYCKAHITDVAYKTWISRIEPVKLDFDAGDAILMVPNEFHRQTLNRCYMPLLNSAVHEIGHQHYLYHSQRGRRKEGGPKRQPGYRLGI